MKHYHKNPRQITASQFQRLQETLSELGDLSGIVHDLNSDEIIGGNQRLEALGLMNATPEIVERHDPPTETGTVALGYYIVNGERFNYRAVRWTPEQCEKANIVANLAGGDWNWDALASWDVSALVSWGFDTEALQGWNNDAANLALMIGAEVETEAPETEDIEPQIDKAEELQEKWRVETGDVWRIGNHFVICGDCREAETWRRLLAAAGVEKVNGVFTSPPYAEQRKTQYGGVPVSEYVEWWDAVQKNVRDNLAEDGSFFVNIKPHCEDGERVLYVFDLVLAMKRRWGWRFVDELCWYRGGYPGKWDNRLKNEFEPVYHFSLGDVKIRHSDIARDFAESTLPDKLTVYDGKDNAPARGGSPFKQKWKKSAVFDGALPGNVLKIPHSETATNTGAYQAAPFPEALPTFFAKAYSDNGDVWLDPFLGSGTTIVAAHNNGRHGLGIEMLPKYVAVILERLQNATQEAPEKLG